MVEEMYLEEMKEHELNGSEEKSSKSGEDPATKTTSPQEKRTSSEIESKSFNSKQDVSKQSQNTPILPILHEIERKKNVYSWLYQFAHDNLK